MTNHIPDIRAVVHSALRTVQGSKHHLGLVTLEVLTDRVTEAVTPLIADTAATAAPGFFQPGHAYTHHDGHDFLCVAVSPHPVTGERLALGWRSEDGAWHRPAVAGVNQWNHEYDGVEPPANTQEGSQ